MHWRYVIFVIYLWYVVFFGGRGLKWKVSLVENVSHSSLFIGVQEIIGIQLIIFIHLVAVPNCHWSEWKRWDSCSATCGRGLQEWRRRCNCIPPVPGGGHCPGFPTKKEDCNNPCPPPPMPGLSYILQSRLKGPTSEVGDASYFSTNI